MVILYSKTAIFSRKRLYDSQAFDLLTIHKKIRFCPPLKDKSQIFLIGCCLGKYNIGPFRQGNALERESAVKGGKAFFLALRPGAWYTEYAI